jgi:hypothetical protein
MEKSYVRLRLTIFGLYAFKEVRRKPDLQLAGTAVSGTTGGIQEGESTGGYSFIGCIVQIRGRPVKKEGAIAVSGQLSAVSNSASGIGRSNAFTRSLRPGVLSLAES